MCVIYDIRFDYITSKHDTLDAAIQADRRHRSAYELAGRPYPYPYVITTLARVVHREVFADPQPLALLRERS